MTSVKKIQVTIAGNVYTLVSDEPEHLVRDAALSVDLLLQEIGHNTGKLDETKSALLAALHFAKKFIMAEDNHNRILAEHTRLLQRIEREII